MLSAASDYRSISDVQNALSDGTITARTLVQQYLQAIEDLNPKLNAVTVLNKDALADAERLDVRVQPDALSMLQLPSTADCCTT